MRALLAALLLALPTVVLAQVELLYIAAADCGYCRRWEAQYLDQRKPKAALDWTGVRFTMVDIGSFRRPYGTNDVPAHLRPGLARALEAAGRSSLRGTPWFGLFVDGELRSAGFGVNSFETRIHPTLRAALREKT